MAALTSPVAPPQPSQTPKAPARPAGLTVQRTTEPRLAEVDFAQLKFGKIFADHMLVARYEGGAWQPAQIVPYGPIDLSPATSALHYGQAIFEGLKAYRQTSGRVVVSRPADNWARFCRSAERMCMPPVPEELFVGGIAALVDLDQGWVPDTAGASLYIRPFMFATDDFIGIRPSDTYTFMIFCCPVGVYYTEPVRVRVERHYSRAVTGGTGTAKAAGNYAGALMPARLAQEAGYHQLVWTDALTHEYFEESGTMNILFVLEGGRLVTPSLTDTILKGITRDSILTLARDMGLSVEERRVSVAEIEQALEGGQVTDIIGMGTAATFAPVGLMNLNGKDYTLPAPSDLSVRLKKRLEDLRTGLVADPYGWMVPVAG